jgi:hypothetical protein
MTATRAMISAWLDELYSPPFGTKPTHMIVACDRFDYEDYPVFVMEGEDVEAKVAEYTGGEFSLKGIHEVYSAALPKEDQLNEDRAWHL